MKLLFGPYIKENPYQKQLTDNLQYLGIQVKDIQETFFKQINTKLFLKLKR